MDKMAMDKMTMAFSAIKVHSEGDQPDDYLRTIAFACRIVGGGCSPVSENGRVALMSAADLLDYIADTEDGALDSPGIGTVTRIGEPIKPDLEVIDRLNRAGLLSRSATLALQSIAITAAYIDYSEITQDVDMMDFVKRMGQTD